MNKLSKVMFIMLIAMLFVAPAYAQSGNAAASGSNYNWALSGIGLGIAVGLAGFGQGKVAASACEGIARNPGARPGIQLAMILGLVFIESLVLFIWVMIFLRAS